MPDPRRLTVADLRAVAGGSAGSGLVRRLRAAELNKHQLLIEAIRRRASSGRFDRIFERLTTVQRTDPDAAAELMARPQVGVWAARCLRELTAGATVDLGYLADPGPLGPRLRVESGGLALSVTVEHRGPYLDVYGLPVATGLSPADLARWRRVLDAAWDLLVRHHRPAAEALAAGLTTLVPLTGTGRPATATSGWAFGAIAATPPEGPLSFAESLVHEFQHVLLGAVSDLVRLIDGPGDRLGYAPWRDDPRPLEALLQGGHAHVGIVGFWHRHRRCGPAAHRPRAEAQLARWLDPTLSVVDDLAGSGALTNLGRVFVADMGDRLREWRADGVSAQARRAAAGPIADHRRRWRLRHLRPDPVAIEALARAWLSGSPPGPVPVCVVADAVPGVPDTVPGMPDGDRPEVMAALCRHLGAGVDLERLAVWLR